MPATDKKKMYVQATEASRITGISTKSLRLAFDEGHLEGYRSPRNRRTRLITIASLIRYCEAHGIEDAINPLRFLALNSYALPPALLIGPFPRNKFGSFDAAFADDLLTAGLLAGQRTFHAIIADGSLGSENLNTALRRFKSPGFGPAVLGVVVAEDVEPEVWRRAGYDMVWQSPVNHELLASELMAALRSHKNGR